MKITWVTFNNRRKAFTVRVASRTLQYPYAKLEVRPSPADPVVRAEVDRELASEAFAYFLKSGRHGVVHVEQVLEYNQDPRHMRDLILYRLTIEAQKRLQASPLSRREIIRRLATSPAQFYRILDQTNYRKSIDQVVTLLHVLDCDVRLVVRPARAS